MSDEDWNTKVPLGIREIFTLTVKLGGTISGEHGIVSSTEGLYGYRL